MKGREKDHGGCRCWLCRGMVGEEKERDTGEKRDEEVEGLLTEAKEMKRWKGY